MMLAGVSVFPTPRAPPEKTAVKIIHRRFKPHARFPQNEHFFFVLPVRGLRRRVSIHRGPSAGLCSSRSPRRTHARNLKRRRLVADDGQPAPNAAPADDESDADEDGRAESVRPRVTDPAAVLRAARVVLVRSNTAFVSDKEVEDSLRKRKEFRAWGMSLTRSDAEADLIIEIERKAFSRRFTFSVLDPRTMNVVTSGKTRSVLFGKKIPNKIAEKFVNRLKTVRPYRLVSWISILDFGLKRVPHVTIEIAQRFIAGKRSKRRESVGRRIFVWLNQSSLRDSGLLTPVAFPAMKLGYFHRPCRDFSTSFSTTTQAPTCQARPVVPHR